MQDEEPQQGGGSDAAAGVQRYPFPLSYYPSAQ